MKLDKEQNGQVYLSPEVCNHRVTSRNSAERSLFSEQSTGHIRTDSAEVTDSIRVSTLTLWYDKVETSGLQLAL